MLLQISQIDLRPLVLKLFQIKEVLPFYYFNNFYLNPTLACQTNASKKNNTGITGITSARGPKTAKAPGSLLNNNVSIKYNIFTLLNDIVF